MNFDIKELPNVHFDYNELLDYFNNVVKHNEQLRFTIPPRDLSIDQSIYPPHFDDSVGIYGYGIQSNLDDVTKPLVPPGDFKQIKSKNSFTKPTVLLQGFAQKILDAFPYCEELGITCHIPGSKLHPHIDKDNHMRIHLPIQTTDKSYFIYENKYVLETGKCYLVNTKRTHSTENHGDLDRIHLLFKVPLDKIDEIISKDYWV